MNTALKPIANLLSTHLGKPKPKRANWSGKVKRLIKKHPELEIKLDHWDKNEYGNWYYIYMRSDIYDKYFAGSDYDECCNNMEGVYDRLIDCLDFLKEKENRS